MASTPIDSRKVKDSGLMNTCLAENTTPIDAGERGAAGKGEELHAHQRHAHGLRGQLVLADRLPGPADVGVLQPAVDEDHDDHDDEQDQEVEVARAYGRAPKGGGRAARSA